MRAIGIADFLAKEFKTYPLEGKLLEHLGLPEQNFKMLVYGHTGNGKTEYCIQLAKYFARFAKVYYNSFEQGVSKTLQDAIRRNDLIEVKGKIVFGNREGLDEMIMRLKAKGSARIVFIDSRDYMNLTIEEFKRLTALFPRKSFIVICWESSGKPKGDHAKSMAYMCDIKVRVANFRALPVSRFGGNKEYVVWDRNSSSGQGKLF
jgi:hypothetical protein